MARLTDPLDRAVAWLHDVVEDTDWTVRGLYRHGRKSGVPFGEGWANTCLTVGMLTHRPNEPRDVYYARIRRNPRAVRVKLADIADNLDEARLTKLPEKKQDDLRKKYREAIAALTEETT